MKKRQPRDPGGEVETGGLLMPVGLPGKEVH